MQFLNPSTPGKIFLRRGIPGRFSAVKHRGRIGVISEIGEARWIHGRYGASLLHPLWKAKREAILKRDGFVCANCGGRQDLEVHHRQYHFLVAENRVKYPWEYPDNLLITLCRPCNGAGHQKFKVPIIKI